MASLFHRAAFVFAAFFLALGIHNAAALDSASTASCGGGTPDAARFAKANQMSAATARILDKTNAEVAILARVGSDQSERGLKYTHAAFALRDHPQGRWSVVHLLNDCGGSGSNIYDQGLTIFYLDDPFRYDTLVLLPNEKLQAALLSLLDGPLPMRLHTPRYSMIAYPRASKYQNSNQWFLEIVAAAQGHIRNIAVDSREDAQSLHKRLGYQGTWIEANGLVQFFASVFKANISTDDHPYADRNRGRLEVVTVASIQKYLQNTGALAAQMEVLDR